MYVVTVEIVLHPDAVGRFMPLMLENARLSQDREPGCRRFDVCAAPEAPERVFLYELYDDAAAFEAHKAMPHFLDFDAATAPFVAAKTVRTYELIGGAS